MESLSQQVLDRHQSTEHSQACQLFEKYLPRGEVCSPPSLEMQNLIVHALDGLLTIQDARQISLMATLQVAIEEGLFKGVLESVCRPMFQAAFQLCDGEDEQAVIVLQKFTQMRRTYMELAYNQMKETALDIAEIQQKEIRETLLTLPVLTSQAFILFKHIISPLQEPSQVAIEDRIFNLTEAITSLVAFLRDWNSIAQMNFQTTNIPQLERIGNLNLEASIDSIAIDLDQLINIIGYIRQDENPTVLLQSYLKYLSAIHRE